MILRRIFRTLFHLETLKDFLFYGISIYSEIKFTNSNEFDYKFKSAVFIRRHSRHCLWMWITGVNGERMRIRWKKNSHLIITPVTVFFFFVFQRTSSVKIMEFRISVELKLKYQFLSETRSKNHVKNIPWTGK